MKPLKKSLSLFILIWLVGWLLALAMLCVVPRANAESKIVQSKYVGEDVLALAKYCSIYLQANKESPLPAVSSLMNTFGNPLPCIERRIAQNNGLKHVQIDLIDATCWRGGRCSPGAPRPNDLKIIEARAREVNLYAVKYPQIEWWISPALEHDERSSVTVTKMMAAAKKGCPTCKLINSPFTGATPAGIPLEWHGTDVSAFSISGDGKSSFDADNRDLDQNKKDGSNFAHWRSGRNSTFGWWNELNLRCTGEKTFTPPENRTERPTLAQFRQWRLIARPEQKQPPAPKACTKMRAFKAGEIYKTNAESYCNGHKNDSRANRPLLIIDKSGKLGNRISILDPKGKVVGCLAYFGPFGNLHRWYVGSCSGQTADGLARAVDGEWGFVETSKGECLAVNVARRMGSYR